MYAHLNENKSTLVQYLDIVHPRLLGVTILRKPSNKWKTFCIGWAVYYVYREESARALAVAVSRQAEGGAVAAPAVDLAVGPVVDRGGVQAAAAVGAGEAPLVPTLNTKVLLWILIHGDLSSCTCIIFDEPHLSSCHHLLRGEDPVVTPETVDIFCKPKYFFQPTNIFISPISAPGTPVIPLGLLLPVRHARVEVDERARLLVRALARLGGHERGEAAGAAPAVAVRAEVLGVAEFAEYLAVGRVAAAHRVQRLPAFQASETRLNMNMLLNIQNWRLSFSKG